MALALVMGLLATGCSATIAASPPTGGSESASAAQRPLSLTLTPKKGARDVAPGEPVRVDAEHGKLSKVRLLNPEGELVKGAMNDARTRWTSSEPLGYGKKYKLTARGVGDDGKSLSRAVKFTTVSPARLVTVQTNILDGATVGVGMPISFHFSAPIANKDAAERALKVTPSRATEGGFYWFSDSWVVWRPKDYWKSGTTVRINADIYGKDLGGGAYGAQDLAERMKIGDRVVAVADGKRHQMTVWINGKMSKRIPIAMGKPGHNTPHGIYTVMSEHRPYTMDSSTYGVPIDDAEGYRITVTHATRLSYSGIFYHSAPWSVWAQGDTNVSHGCINMSTQNADWLMKKSRPGDIVEVRDSGGVKLDATDGWSVWQLSWKRWQTGGEK